MKIQLTQPYLRGNRPMFVRYWQTPWRELETLANQVDRLFEDLTVPAEVPPAWVPAIELKDNADYLELRAQLPGVDAKDVDIQVTRQSVQISGEYHQEEKTEDSGYVKSEFRYGKFQRVIPLPVGVENDQVKADFTHGILTLTLPKVAKARNSVVKVNLTEAKSDTEPVAEPASDETM